MSSDQTPLCPACWTITRWRYGCRGINVKTSSSVARAGAAAAAGPVRGGLGLTNNDCGKNLPQPLLLRELSVQ